MIDKARDLLHKALDLPSTERAVLATELVASLEDNPETTDPKTVEGEWAEEISRRLRDVLEGRTETVSFDDAIVRAREAVAEVRRGS